MSVGLIALLDDVAALAKVAAASLDDVAAQATKAGAKAAGVVIDDAAVTPRYVTGFSAKREVPIVGRIALGSLRNKLAILLPAALLLSYFAPWTINPLLMLGGAFLCYEGAEKVYETIAPESAHEHEACVETISFDATSVEEEKIASAIKTDFILSAEIMAITLGAVPEQSLMMQAAVLALVGIGITVAVYGAVALIVKADDAGVYLARIERPGGLGDAIRALGRAMVKGMPFLLAALGIVGTAAMIWVGGGIILHGMEIAGVGGPAHFVHALADQAGDMAPVAEDAIEWLVSAALAGAFGLILGCVLIPVVSYVVAPVWRAAKRLLGKRIHSRVAG
ncbi:MAG TPA: DUF808 domain-containing protein [Rhabdaerophilum sp.]|nr:DUF808 domain-containing protein [Rhabdaerophilum sp.]